MRIDATRFCRCNPVADLCMWLRILDLLRARVGCNDGMEVAQQFYRSLAVTSRAIPCQIAARGDGREVLKKFVRIARTKFGVVNGVPGKMILELHRRAILAAQSPLAVVICRIRAYSSR